MAQPGDILAGRWRLMEAIDAGAMGVIYRGSHDLLGHPVAVKVLLPETARDPRAIERFLREAQIAARLRHRNVVRVEDFGLDGGPSASEPGTPATPFLVMELLEGESLARRLAQGPRLTARQVQAIVRQIAAALDTAHAAGIIHRDLKPENIFLARDIDGAPSVPGVEAEPVVKVLDFGVAKFTDRLGAGGGATASNTLVGTPRYMSPEQARSSRELDGRSDLWSLGMLTYEMLTGAHPFEGEAIAELLVAILTHRIAPPSALRPELPPALDNFIDRALARPRHERFATGKLFADALCEALVRCPQDGWAQDPAPGPSYDPRRGTVRVARNRVLTPLSTVAPLDDVVVPARTSVRVRRSGRGSVPEIEADLAAIAALQSRHTPLPTQSPPDPPERDLSPPVATAPAPAVHPVAGSMRSSWWAVVAVAVAASFGLVAVARKGPWRSSRAPVAVSQSAPAPVAAEPLAAPARPSGVAAEAPRALVPEAVPMAVPTVVPVPAAVVEEGPAVEEVPRRTGRHRRRHGVERHRRRHGPHAPYTPGDATPQGRSVYDPDAV